MTVGQDTAETLAEQVIGLLGARRATIAVAESLTGGLLAAALASVPGASAVLRGGVVAYATDLKTVLLGVPADLLASHGAVDPDVAAAMAEGVARQLSASVGVGTTGVAGPDPVPGEPRADGQREVPEIPIGTVYVAVHFRGRTAGRALALSGDRQAIRAATVSQALALTLSAVREDGL
jgi:nicotinamide-nucleotide amidase